jgi:uncharacterized caspase-like protein
MRASGPCARLAADRGEKRLRQSLCDFAELAETADISWLYLTGHGVDLGGENLLVPVDADSRNEGRASSGASLSTPAVTADDSRGDHRPYARALRALGFRLINPNDPFRQPLDSA